MKPIKMLVLALIICLPVLLPFLKPQFFHLHDWTHVARLYELDQAVRDGHFPVRWSRNLGFGYGIPQFNFYAPLAYYLAEGFHLIGFSFLWSIKLTFIANFLISFLAMYYLVKNFWGTQAGIIAATAFTYAPYRAVDTYVRGALGELTAITWITLIPLAFFSWSKKPNARRFGLTAVTIGGLILSHNLIALITLPLLGLLMLLYLVFTRRRQLLPRLILLFILGLSIAAFYAIPSFMEKGYTQVDKITTGFSDFHHHFLYLRQFIQTNWGYGGSIFGPEDDMSFALGYPIILLSIIGVISIWTIKKQDQPSRVLLILSVSLIAVSILMCTFKTQWLWESIPILKYVQFPWRYLSIIIVFISILCGGIGLHLSRQPKFTSTIFLVVAVLAIILPHLRFFRPQTYLADNQLLYYTDPNQISSQMSTIIPDFLPTLATASPTPPTARFIIDPPPTTSKLIIDRTHEIYVSASLTQPSVFTANIHYFPGWTWYIDGQRVAITITKEGLIQFNLPKPGEVTISGQFQETPLRLLSNLISIGSIMITIYLIISIKKIPSEKARLILPKISKTNYLSSRNPES